jgi:adenylosuccinate synthase
MNENASIVLGTLFGDEGKGAFVNFLAKQAQKPLIIRFNGGHQVGHTVVLEDGTRHVFSNFGSGTLQGAPTFWSKYCTMSPTGVKREAEELHKRNIHPIVIYDANAMVTTPFDILRNRNLEGALNHGSVGVGFGQTIQRNEDMYHLYVRDLWYPAIRDAKLQNIINKYYNHNFDPNEDQQNAATRKLYNEFIEACDFVVKNFSISNDGLRGLQDCDWIFEGGQGIMLDMDYGFFPHVTRSNTTAKNAVALIKEYRPELFIKTFYMTRAYQCRHGNGQMTNEHLDTSYIIDNPDETNVDGGFQGAFRKSVLDIDMLQYAINCDIHENPKSQRILVVTCLDQVPPTFPVTRETNVFEIGWKEIVQYITPDMESWGTWSDEGYKYPWQLEKEKQNEVLDTEN